MPTRPALPAAAPSITQAPCHVEHSDMSDVATRPQGSGHGRRQEHCFCTASPRS